MSDVNLKIKKIENAMVYSQNIDAEENEQKQIQQLKEIDRDLKKAKDK